MERIKFKRIPQVTQPDGRLSIPAQYRPYVELQVGGDPSPTINLERDALGLPVGRNDSYYRGSDQTRPFQYGKDISVNPPDEPLTRDDMSRAENCLYRRIIRKQYSI